MVLTRLLGFDPDVSTGLTCPNNCHPYMFFCTLLAPPPNNCPHPSLHLLPLLLPTTRPFLPMVALA